MSEKNSILLVEDEKPVLLSLKKIVANKFPDLEILTAEDGKQAWSLINTYRPSIVISDINMPEMTGLELLKKVREIKEFDNLYFIILTADVDQKTKIETLENGADDFINKPMVLDAIIARIRSALRIVKMQQLMLEENILLNKLTKDLENELKDMVTLSIKFIEARVPAIGDRIKRVVEASIWIAEQYDNFDNDKIRKVEIAAYFSQCGRVYLPDSVINNPVMKNGMLTDNLMIQVPNYSKQIVSSISRFEDVADIIYHIYENLDGSGFPNKLQSWQIPFESRIIRVALDYEEILNNTNLKPNEIIDQMMKEAKRLYDHRVVVLMDHFIRTENREEFNPNETGVSLAHLKSGMILTRDIFTDKGNKLMSAGGTLTEKSVERILSHNINDPILGCVYVQK